jgi:Ca2+-binding EF-hand superfamily protein
MEQWYRFDKNSDGKISFDEFVNVYNTVLDR